MEWTIIAVYHITIIGNAQGADVLVVNAGFEPCFTLGIADHCQIEFCCRCAETLLLTKWNPIQLAQINIILKCEY